MSTEALQAREAIPPLQRLQPGSGYTIKSSKANGCFPITKPLLIIFATLAGGSGCYGGGNLGPFGEVGALLEDNPSTNLGTQTVTRFIYVLDIAAGKKSTGVELDIYQKTDVINSAEGQDHVTVTLANKVSLPLVGGATAIASMAGNTDYLVIGTTKSPEPVLVTKSTLAVEKFGEFLPPVNVHAVSADAYGYSTVEFGKFGGSEPEFT